MNFFGGRKLVFLRLVDLLDFHENWPECSSDISCGQALGRMTLTFSEMLWSGPGHDDFDLFGNARITSDEIGCSM